LKRSTAPVLCELALQLRDGIEPKKANKPIAKLLQPAGLDLDAATGLLAEPSNVLAANHLRKRSRWPERDLQCSVCRPGSEASVVEFVARRRPSESGHQLADEMLDVASEGVARRELGRSFEAEVEQADVGSVGEQRASPGLAPRLAERHVA
jgi:hypothetical protein